MDKIPDTIIKQRGQIQILEETVYDWMGIHLL